MNKLKKIRDIFIYKDENYCSFPNAIVLKDGTVMVCFRQAPDWQEKYNDVTHLDPSSRGVFVKSSNNGKTWSANPELIYQHFLYGIQDPCLNYLKDGTILGTFFMWKVFEREEPLKNPEKHHFINDFYYGEIQDAHTIRSYDNGKTWDEPIKIEYKGKDDLKSSLRGNTVELPDGSVLLALPTYDMNQSRRFIRIIKSFDCGKTWKKLYDIPKPENCFMGEPNLFRTESGKIACFIRTHIDVPGKNVYEDGNQEMSPMHVSFSHDNGETWSNSEKTRFFSPSPFHALQLKSGNVLLSYGHRYSPYGIKVILLDGELKNIHEAKEIFIRDDGVNHDLGYTSSVQMQNGDILVTYYIFHKNDTTRYIAGTILREE